MLASAIGFILGGLAIVLFCVADGRAVEIRHLRRDLALGNEDNANLRSDLRACRIEVQRLKQRLNDVSDLALGCAKSKD